MALEDSWSQHDQSDDEGSRQKNCSCIQNKCLHQAIIMDIEEIRVQEHISELLVRNHNGELPLHLACKHENKSNLVESLLKRPITKEIKRKQLFAINDIFGNTPLHVAAFLGNEMIVKKIINNCDEKLIQELLQQKNKLNDTPVHAAAAKNHHSILKIMYMKNDRKRRKFILTLEGRFKGWPIHAACGYGHIESVKKMVRWGQFHQISILEKRSVPANLPAFTKTSELKTMNKVQEKKYKETIDSLCSSAAKTTHQHYTPLTRACQFGNVEVVKFLLQEGATQHPLALIKAIDGLHHDCVELLVLEKSFPTKNLDFSYLAFDGSYVPTTPFRELIKHMPDIAEMVIDLNCVKLERFMVNSENFRIRLNYNLVNSNKEWDLVKLIDEDYTHSLSDTKRRRPPVKSHVNSKETHPLSLMVKHKREQLLTHPVVAGLIHDKWNSIYGILNIGHLILYILMYMISIHILLIYYSNSTQDIPCGSNHNHTSVIRATQFNGYAATMLLIYSCFRIALETLQLGFAILRFRQHWNLHTLVSAIREADYIWDLTNWIEVLLFILSIILVPGQRNMGAFILWLSWFELIFLTIQFEIIGVHALMFWKILKTLVKFIPFASFLIFGFGLTFQVLLDEPKLKSPYSNISYSLLKTLALAAGDLNTDEFIKYEKEHDVQYLTVLWILSLTFMTILLSNLLIGLAVGDIQMIASKAIFEKLTLQVGYLLSIECLLSSSCNKLENKEKWLGKVFEPNTFQINVEFVRKWFVYLAWGGERYDSQESITRMISSAKNLEEKQFA